MKSGRRRYTLVFHRYIGYGSYIIEFERIMSRPRDIKKRRNVQDLHFIITGWPLLCHPNGEAWEP